MTSLVQLVAAANAEQDLSQSPLPQQIAHGINNGTHRLVLLVKELGEQLTSEDDATRAKGVALLSAVVTNTDKAVLDRQSTKTLTTFFTDKLSEKQSVAAAATALTALTESPAFGVLEGMEVARGIFSSLTLKAHAQPIRHTVYVLLDHLMTHARPALKRLKAEFPKGYAELVDGEKDPRNLMISFNLVRVMLLEFEIEGCVEDLFDITFCYFPITFTPPPDDPYGISSDDLILSLRSCLSSTPSFGPLALPLFYDKLQAASEKAKRQTLEALAACFPIYGAKACGEWAGRLSEALVVEVFHASDTDMQDLALKTLRSLFATLYPDSTPAAPANGADESAPPLTPGGEDTVMTSPEGGESASAAEQDEEQKPKAGDKIEGVALKVVENSLDELNEPEKNNAKPAVRILTALIAASDRLARHIISVTFPPLLSMYKNPDDMSLRPSVLTHLSTLLASLSAPPTSSSSSATTTPTSVTPAPALPLFPPPTLSHADSASPLEPYRDDLLSILTSSTRLLSTRLAAIEALVFLVRLPGFLSAQEVDFCLSALNDVLASCAPAPSSDPSANASAAPSGADEEAYSVALSSLVALSALPSTLPLLERSTLPLLLSSLPATISPSPGSATSTAYRLALESLAELARPAPLCAVLARRLAGRVEEVLAASFTGMGGEEEEKEHAALYAHHLLATLRAVLSAKARRNDPDVEGYVDGLVPQLVAMLVLPTTRAAEDGAVARDLRVVVDVGRVVGTVLRKVGAERQTSFFAAVNEAFHEGKLELLLGEKAAKEAGDVPFAPFAPSAPLAQRNLLSLYSSLLLPLPSTVPFPPSPSRAALLPLLSTLIAHALDASNELQLQAGVWLVASLVNKREGEEGVKGWLEGEGRKGLWEGEVLDGGKGEERRKRALRIWTWLAKALVTRSSPTGYALVEQLLSLFADPVLGRAAATGLGVIAEDGDRVLSKENGAVIRLLFKQRFFTFLLPKLVAGYKDSTAAGTDAGATYLIALSSLLQHIPKQLTLTELPKLLPLLLNALDLPSPVLRANVIDALSVLVKEVPSDVETSIGSVVAKVLKGLTAEREGGRAGAHLRLSSLAFLATLPAHIPYTTLHSQKATILKELGRAIDDPRRDVRRAAVECRGKWYLYTG
ncbi:hypothetical protein JCM10207_003581 [Rhodosporidiobolus poonsookiae]